MNMKRSRLATIVVATLIGLAAGLVGPLHAQAGTLSTRVFDFNVCDQPTGANDLCTITSDAIKAQNIANSIVSSGSNVATFQEMCRTTFNLVLQALGPSWDGELLWTTFLPMGDDRCNGPSEWGIGVMARGPMQRVDGLSPGKAQLPNPYGENEPRFLWCANFTIAASFRVCSSHFSFRDDANDDQAAAVATQLRQYSDSGGAILLGADTNINVAACDPGIPGSAYSLRPMYVGAFGGSSTNGCISGYGVMYEVDQQHSGNPGPFNVATFGSQKIDAVYFNYPKWYADYNGVVNNAASGMSDHRILRGTGTLFW
jgi:hypothetical protein